MTNPSTSAHTSITTDCSCTVPVCSCAHRCCMQMHAYTCLKASSPQVMHHLAQHSYSIQFVQKGGHCLCQAAGHSSAVWRSMQKGQPDVLRELEVQHQGIRAAPGTRRCSPCLPACPPACLSCRGVRQDHQPGTAPPAAQCGGIQQGVRRHERHKARSQQDQDVPRHVL